MLSDGLRPTSVGLVLGLAGVADACSAGMAPDLGRQKQKTQSCRGQLRMFHLGWVGRSFGCRPEFWRMNAISLSNWRIIVTLIVTKIGPGQIRVTDFMPRL